jgi:hypothetical protein
MEFDRKIDMILNEESAYEKFFKKKLKEWGIKSPAELSKQDKIKFFEEIDKGWTGKSEK